QGVNKEVNHKTNLNNEETVPQSKTQEDKTEKLHPIDKAERDCIAKDYSNAGMNECGYKAMDSWFKEIDKYLGLLKTVTSEEDYSNILKAQEDWKKYQESEFVSISLIRNKQGTIYQTIAIGQYVHIIKQRALDLKNLYEYLIE
ncbi:MAG: lysozyme inhibitor LprI family protein, partial [bacterium]|nr:lysozyme inhibitor LprI family protein [bacterium]